MEHIFTTEDFSVEEAYTVGVCFCIRIFDLIEKRIPSEDPEIFIIHELFCTVVCVEGICCAEWNEAIYRTTNIFKENQRDLRFLSDDIFLITIEFCKFYNEYYEKKLYFLVDFLKNMRKNPNAYKNEWNLFKTVLREVKEFPDGVSFDWDALYGV